MSYDLTPVTISRGFLDAEDKKMKELETEVRRLRIENEQLKTALAKGSK